MTSVEVSAAGEATSYHPFEEKSQGVLSPVADAAPVNNDLRMYTKSVEQAEVAAAAAAAAAADEEKKREEEEEGIEVTKAQAKAVLRQAAATAAQKKREANAKKFLGAPIPLKASRSFQVTSNRSFSSPNNNKEEEEAATTATPPAAAPYAFHRSLSFGHKYQKQKQDTAAGVKASASEDRANNRKAGVPLLRRLSFRGKKETKMTHEQQPAAKPPTAPKPPLPNGRSGKLPNALLEEAMAKKLKAKAPLPPNSNSHQEEKKETDTEAAQVQPASSKDSQRPNTQKKGIIAELEARRNDGKIRRTPTYQEPDDDEDETPVKVVVVETVESQQADESSVAKESLRVVPKSAASGGGGRVKSVASKEATTSASPNVFMTEMAAAVLNRGSLRSIKSKAPTAPSKEEEDEMKNEVEAPPLAADLKKEEQEKEASTEPTDVPVAAAPKAEEQEKESSVEPIPTEQEPTAPEEPTKEEDPETADDVAKTEEEKSGPVAVATPAEPVEEATSKAADSSAPTTETKTETSTAAPTNASVEMSKKEKDADQEEATEATDTDGPVTEEKEGLVVTSSASEIEVSAGNGFFCQKFCCGLTLNTAGSN